MGTLRQRIIAALQNASMDQQQLSQALGISEKEVALHLPHIAKSVAARKMNWHVKPAYCENCHFTFKERRRLTPPSKCPHCKASRIRGPWFHIDGHTN